MLHHAVNVDMNRIGGFSSTSAFPNGWGGEPKGQTAVTFNQAPSRQHAKGDAPIMKHVEEAVEFRGNQAVGAADDVLQKARQVATIGAGLIWNAGGDNSAPDTHGNIWQTGQAVPAPTPMNDIFASLVGSPDTWPTYDLGGDVSNGSSMQLASQSVGRERQEAQGLNA